MPLDPKRSSQTRSHGAPRDEPVVRCARCGTDIARECDRIQIGDASLHTFVNPDGVVFRLSCFTAAPGCVEVGEPTLHWTWFPGCAWQVALCGSCHTHLGWRYSGADEFFGLIEDRLARGSH